MAFLLALPYICSAVIGGTAVGTAVGAAVAISKNSTIKELQEKEY
jgi:type IV secretory pathway TrbL component